jgi:phosphoesterase RecJ-like protein
MNDVRDHDPLAVPPRRAEALRAVLRRLKSARSPLLTTHVNADGDGAGSEVALAAWLRSRGARPIIVNPTRFPDRFRFLLDDTVQVLEPGEDADPDLVVVLDTGEPSRIGKVARSARGHDVVVVDHHPPSDSGFDADAAVLDPSACATGELVYDLIRTAEHDAPSAPEWPPAVAAALYAAIVTDTGSFRFANTTPRTHAIAGDLVRRGVDPEEMYRHIYATVPLRQLHVLRAALDNLDVDPDLPISWVSIPHNVIAELGVTADDLDGVVEYPRSIEGTEVALVFRETVEGGTKVSLRSNGAVDVNAIARHFGGGGHVKAAGAVVGKPLAAARDAVLAEVRAAVRALENHFQHS